MNKTIYLFDKDCEYNIKKVNGNIAFYNGETLKYRFPYGDVGSIVLFNNTQLTVPCIKMLLENEIDVLYCDYGGRLIARLESYRKKNIKLRLSQYRISLSEEKTLAMAKYFFNEKITAQYKFLYRLSERKKITTEYIKYKEFAMQAKTVSALLGIEGYFAEYYFGKYFGLFKYYKPAKRTRRPAEDTVNSLMNLCYTLTSSYITINLSAEGFDCSIGYLHSLQEERDNLTCDVIEIFRSKCDAFILKLFNRKEFTANDFYGKEKNFYLKKDAYKKFLLKYNDEFLIISDMEEIIKKLAMKITEMADE